jgi:hypothetical protein
LNSCRTSSLQKRIIVATTIRGNTVDKQIRMQNILN